MSAVEMKTFENQLEGLSFAEQLYVMVQNGHIAN